MEWKDVEGYEGIYSISSNGDILSSGFHFYNARGLYCFRKPRILKKCLNSEGYVTSILTRGKTFKNVKVHRLVALAFLGSPPTGKGQVNHKNGVKSDNRVENLEWISGQDNIRHAFATGLNYGRKGESSLRSKLKDRDVIDIRDRYSNGETIASMARSYGVTETCIRLVCKRKSWTHL